MQDITGDRGVLKEVIRAGAGEMVPEDASVLGKTSFFVGGLLLGLSAKEHVCVLFLFLY